ATLTSNDLIDADSLWVCRVRCTQYFLNVKNHRPQAVNRGVTAGGNPWREQLEPNFCREHLLGLCIQLRKRLYEREIFRARAKAVQITQSQCRLDSFLIRPRP